MMWRAFFLALGIFTVVLGGECLVVDRFVMASDQPPPTNTFTAFQAPRGNRDFVPPEWAPWSLLSVGAVVIIYSFTLNKGGS